MKQLLVILLLLGQLLQAEQAKPPVVSSSKPNVILLMGDDHGWEEVGYNGHPYVKTPFLDEMAKSGLRFDNFYAQPSCSPTRGNVLTGRHPNRYGIFVRVIRFGRRRSPSGTVSKMRVTQLRTSANGTSGR